MSIIVLSSRKTSRNDAFFAQIESEYRSEIVAIPGVYLDSSGANHFNTKVFTSIFQREMSLQEMGCSEAHRNARKLVAESQIGGIVFEDDARFEEFEVILESAQSFLLENRGESSILNICESKLSRFDTENPWKYRRILGHSPLAVAYVLTPEAAKDLLAANTRNTWVSDWPRSKVRHYVSLPALVKHGDAESGSEIADLNFGSDFRHKESYSVVRSILSSLSLRSLLNSILGKYFQDFFYFKMLAPLYWRIDLCKRRCGEFLR